MAELIGDDGLTNKERNDCRDAFDKFDKDASGAISDWELRAMLQSMGQDPTDEEIFDMIAAVDEDGSAEIDFKEFCAVIKMQKDKESNDGESDTLDAFIALGGNADKTGQVSTDKLRHVVKEFGLTIDINRLIAETDTDRSGFIDYNEFAVMMK